MSGSLAWVRAQISGDFVRHLNDTLRVLETPALMEKIGVRARWVPIRDGECEVSGIHDGTHVVEDDLATTMADYAFPCYASVAAASLGFGGGGLRERFSCASRHWKVSRLSRVPSRMRSCNC